LYIFGGNQVSSNLSSLNSLEYAEIITPVSVVDENITKLPHTQILSQNYPNPFNPSTTIEYELSKQTRVKLTVFNIRGQAVKTLYDEVNSPGNYDVQWNGMDQQGNQVSTGVYFCRLEAGDYSKTIKMMYMK
ncbi:MAG: T9SS type A sorting domain-containing protein, partial [Candidatus Marinimicrobia bacterium]|nr:T9SS type A sorting domain-containing protein [Candidatus Neomarinimicrobiota bacterium]